MKTSTPGRKGSEKVDRNYMLPRYVKCIKCGQYFETTLPPIPSDGKDLEKPSLLCPNCVITGRYRKRRR